MIQTQVAIRHALSIVCRPLPAMLRRVCHVFDLELTQEEAADIVRGALYLRGIKP